MENTHFENKIKKSKKDILNEYITKFEKTSDALDYGIEPGILKQVALLNALDYFTTQSCEGHLDKGAPYAWIDFGSEIEKREYELQEQNKSIYWNVYNTARNTAFQKELEKYPNLEIIPYTDEMCDNWLEIFETELVNSENYSEFVAIEKEITDSKQKTREKISELLVEYNLDYPKNKVFLFERGLIRMCFISEEIFKNINSEEISEIKQKSDETLKKFENFLENKYLKY